MGEGNVDILLLFLIFLMDTHGLYMRYPCTSTFVRIFLFDFIFPLFFFMAFASHRVWQC